MKVYVASAWWRDCDPFVSVVSLNRERAADLIDEEMRDEAERAADSDMEDAKELDDYLDDMAWSGVQEFEDTDNIGLTGDIRDELREQGFAWLPTY